MARVLVFALAVSHPSRFKTSDSLEYDRLAHHFHEAYVSSRQGPLFDLSLLRPPGYPALIAAVNALGGGATAVIVVELLLSVATVGITYLLAAALFDRHIATVAAFLLAIDPISIAMSSNLTAETLFALLLVAAALLLVGRSRVLAVGAGLAIGLSVLVRPISMYLPLVLVFTMPMLLRRRWVAVLIAAAIPIGAWMA
ncbi:MAG: glycosyltransferase family 39 protein, partial [Actinomycetota bacterium]